ncbi:hypothetical protein [Pseudomonas citronellolis]|nr:hypothetical protein [Pseudomonas citronellolis]
MRSAMLIAVGIVLLGLAAAGAIIAVPLAPAFVAMLWGCHP